jgi:parallel beta-helix repeat protein/predicted outer membrane repeat protein
VTTTLDETNPNDGLLSLREAIAMVNANQVADNSIILPPGTYQITIPPKAGGGSFTIDKFINLEGSGAGQTIIDGNGLPSVFSLQADPNSVSYTAAFSGLTIRNGATQGAGGGLDAEGTAQHAVNLLLTDCTVSGNTATSSGGGICVQDGYVTLRRCTITGNRSGGPGGGIAWVNGTALTITDSTVSNNTALHGGGGIYASGTTLTVTGSTVSSNQALTGGGLEIQTSGFGADASVLTNDTISLNVAKGFGGGINRDVTPGTVTLLNDTIARNSTTNGQGGGVCISGPGIGGPLSVKNTIIALNSVPFDAPDVDNGGVPVNLVDAGHNLIGNNDFATLSFVAGIPNAAGSLVGTPGTPIDPDLGPLQNNGGLTQTCALLPGSLAIDRGDDAGAPATDQRGVSRPQGPHVDIGAFEFVQGSTPPHKHRPIHGRFPPRVVSFHQRLLDDLSEDLFGHGLDAAGLRYVDMLDKGVPLCRVIARMEQDPRHLAWAATGADLEVLGRLPDAAELGRAMRLLPGPGNALEALEARLAASPEFA